MGRSSIGRLMEIILKYAPVRTEKVGESGG